MSARSTQYSSLMLSISFLRWWLAYGLSTGSIPLIVVDTVGLLCAGLTLAVALSLRGSLSRPATWSSCP